MNRVLPGLLMAAAWLLLSFGPAALMVGFSLALSKDALLARKPSLL